jgi:hypothetical protein
MCYVKMRRRACRLRLVRFSTCFGAVLFADFAITVSLWLSGGPSKEPSPNVQLELSIVEFTFKTSVFDLLLFSLLNPIGGERRLSTLICSLQTERNQ